MGKLKKILVVEDDPLFSFLIEDFLLSKGFEVTCVASVLSSILSAFESDLILMDQHLPDGFGFDAAKEIHKNNPKLPIISLSADTIPVEYQKEFIAHYSKSTEINHVLNQLLQTINNYFLNV